MSRTAKCKRQWLLPRDVEAERLIANFHALVRLVGLSRRARNGLWRLLKSDVAGVAPRDWEPNPGPVARYSEAELLSVPGFGRGSLREVLLWLEAYGMGPSLSIPWRGRSEWSIYADES